MTISAQANRFELLNGNQPPQAKLPRGDKDVMEEFIDNIRILLGSLGYRLLDPLIYRPKSLDDIPPKDLEETLNLKAKKYQAQAKQTDEGIVVLEGAEASITANMSLSKGYAKVRNTLIDRGQLKEDNDKLI